MAGLGLNFHLELCYNTKKATEGTAMTRIVIVEDNPADLAQLRDCLRRYEKD